MKNNWAKRLSALALAGVMAFSLAACGAEKAEEQETSSALTAEEYQQAVTTLSEDMQEVLERASEIDEADASESTEALEALKAPLEEFMAVEPPEKYAAGHEKVCEGCEALIDYIDIVIATIGVTNEETLTQAAAQMETAAEQATTALQEGVELLQQADDGE